MPPLGQRKQEVRERIWALLEEHGVARFPLPLRDRIPNFKGAEAAAARAAELPEFEAARRIKCNPDSPQRPLRLLALHAGKIVFMAVPRLRAERCFLRLDPARLGGKLAEASTIKGASVLGEPVTPRELGRIDLVVAGSVAVNARGARVGGPASAGADRGAPGRTGSTPTMTNVSRRQLLSVFVLAAGASIGRNALAQPPRLFKIGALTESWGPTPAVVGLRDGLQQLGYREDEHFTIGVRFTEGRITDLPAAAADLVRHRVDIIVTTESGGALKAAQAATNRIPIVFIGSSDPVGLGVVQSFARPGGNITGIADLDIELAPKRMQIFRELVPDLKRVLVPYDATNPQAVAQLDVHRDAARRLGLTLLEKPLRSEDEARVSITGLRKGEVDGIFTLRALSLNIPGFVLEIAPRGVVPTMFHIPFFVEKGGLASYSANTHELGKQAARLVDKILKGVKPADLPVEQPTKFELVINHKTAKALGLTIPPPLLLQADRVIQ